MISACRNHLFLVKIDKKIQLSPCGYLFSLQRAVIVRIIAFEGRFIHISLWGCGYGYVLRSRRGSLPAVIYTEQNYDDIT